MALTAIIAPPRPKPPNPARMRISFRLRGCSGSASPPPAAPPPFPAAAWVPGASAARTSALEAAAAAGGPVPLLPPCIMLGPAAPALSEPWRCSRLASPPRGPRCRSWSASSSSPSSPPCSARCGPFHSSLGRLAVRCCSAGLPPSSEPGSVEGTGTGAGTGTRRLTTVLAAAPAGVPVVSLPGFAAAACLPALSVLAGAASLLLAAAPGAGLPSRNAREGRSAASTEMGARLGACLLAPPACCRASGRVPASRTGARAVLAASPTGLPATAVLRPAAPGAGGGAGPGAGMGSRLRLCCSLSCCAGAAGWCLL